MTNEVDVRENYILNIDRDLLKLLLFDHTTKKNMFWATDNHTNLGERHQSGDKIVIENVTGKHSYVIKPRINKSRKGHLSRIKGKNKAFTPSLICYSQNNNIKRLSSNKTMFSRLVC